MATFERLPSGQQRVTFEINVGNNGSRSTLSDAPLSPVFRPISRTRPSRELLRYPPAWSEISEKFAAWNGFRTNVNEMSDSRGTRPWHEIPRRGIGTIERNRAANLQLARYLVYFYSRFLLTKIIIIKKRNVANARQRIRLIVKHTKYTERRRPIRFPS